MKKKILCYGDSNTYGYIPAGNGKRYPAPVRWTGQLQALLGEDYVIIGEGCSGRTAEGALPGEEFKDGMKYLKTSLHTHKPLDMIILMLGTNDLKTAFHKDENMIAGNIRKLIKESRSYMKLKQESLPEIFLICPAPLLPCVMAGPFADGFNETSMKVSRKLAALYRKIAEEEGLLFLDLGSFAEVSPADGVHLTAGGHTAAAQKISRVIRTYYKNDTHTNPDFLIDPDVFFQTVRVIGEDPGAGEDDFRPALRILLESGSREEILSRLEEEAEKTPQPSAAAFLRNCKIRLSE